MLDTWIFYADRTDWATYARMPWQHVKEVVSNRRGWLYQALIQLPCWIFLVICWWDCKFMDIMPISQLQGTDNMTFVKDHIDLLRGSQVFVLHGGIETVPMLQKEGITPYSLTTGLEFYSVKNLNRLYADPPWHVYLNYQEVVSAWDKGDHRLITSREWQKTLHYVGDFPFTLQFIPLVCEYNVLDLCIFDIQPDPADV